MSVVDIVCNKCGSVIYTMRMLKSVRDILRSSNSRCTACGAVLNPGDFTVLVERR